MSDQNERGLEGAEPHGEGLLDRIRVALGLKAHPSIRQDLAEALEETGPEDDSGFSPEERAMLRNILTLRGQRVDDVMVPRADIIAVPVSITLGGLLDMFQTAGHSRLPVYGETLDDPRGMVHIRDFVAWLASRAAIASGRGARPAEAGRGRGAVAAQLAFGSIDLTASLDTVKALVRSVLFVPRSMPALDLLARMQASRTQLALVIDEYGGTDGLVTMEDIVETVIGDIEDEHDEAEAEMVQPGPGGTVTADGRADLSDVSEAVGRDLEADLEAGNAEAEVDTLGGYLVTLVGRVPVRGEIVPGPGAMEFEILDADPRRVKRVRVHPQGSAGERGTPAPQPEPAREASDREVPADAMALAERAEARSLDARSHDTRPLEPTPAEIAAAEYAAADARAEYDAEGADAEETGAEAADHEPTRPALEPMGPDRGTPSGGAAGSSAP